MRAWIAVCLSIALVGAASAVASATSLQVSPVSVEVTSPAAVSTVTLRNLGAEPIDAQVRVFQWSQSAGADELVATRNVVASPPAVRLAPGKDYVVRIVRVDKTPVAGEEAYRLLIDEIPKKRNSGSTAVKLAVRYSIPVFFDHEATDASLTWDARIVAGHLQIEARNKGERRVRISALNVVNQSGRQATYGAGLVGYVLGHSSMHWTAKAAPAGLKPGTAVTIIAQSDNGPVKATATVRAQK